MDSENDPCLDLDAVRVPLPFSIIGFARRLVVLGRLPASVWTIHFWVCWLFFFPISVLLYSLQSYSFQLIFHFFSQLIHSTQTLFPFKFCRGCVRKFYSELVSILCAGRMEQIILKLYKVKIRHARFPRLEGSP